MSEVVYLLGAGASYGVREIDKTGGVMPGHIIRGLPTVNQLEAAIDWYCKRISDHGSYGQPLDRSKYHNLYNELKWLKEMCQSYPTIDTYAKQLTVTNKSNELTRLKNALSSFFVLIQDHKKRDLRYDGFVASIIQDDGTMPKTISILSWNYDYQMEYVLRDFSESKKELLQFWKDKGVACKGFDLPIDCSKFNCVKLNGTAMFSTIKGNDLIDPAYCDLERIEKCYKDDFMSWKSNISFAWEKDEKFIDSVLPLVKKAESLVIIGYSFPYVNRAIDKKIIQNMSNLRNVYIQDLAATDVKQSFETLLSYDQQQDLLRTELKIYPRTSVNQFIIPNELS